jgi:hypothetical protein
MPGLVGRLVFGVVGRGEIGDDILIGDIGYDSTGVFLYFPLIFFDVRCSSFSHHYSKFWCFY